MPTMVHCKLMNIKNTFKPIRGYEALYAISYNGDVFNKTNKRMLKPSINNGYKRVSLFKDGKWRKFYLHRLIAIEFIDNECNFPVINHKNGDKLDNRLSNIEWCTYLDNNIHAVKTGLRGTRVRQTSIDGVFINDWRSVSEAVRAVNGTSRSGIANCTSGRAKTCAGYVWSHI